MQIITVQVDELKDAEYNPRKIDAESYQQLRDSIVQQGYVESLVWNKQTGNLISGHQRLKILKELGKTEIEVSVVDMPLAEEKILNIRLNKPAGEWDLVKLQEIFSAISTEQIRLTGFKEDEVNQLCLFGSDFELPKVDIKGDLPIKTDFITIVFDDDQQYEEMKAKLLMGKNQRIINFIQFKERYNEPKI